MVRKEIKILADPCPNKMDGGRIYFKGGIMAEQEMTYEKAGVNIDEAEKFINMIRERIGKAWPEKAGQIGGFAGLAKIPYRRDYLAASTDGVGTKLIIAALMESYDGVGQDAVAMSAVDTYVNGQKPRYLLDYFATGKLEADKHIKIINSLIYGCKEAGCSIIGGETAEMPGFFKHDWMVDLVTFVIGFPDPGLVRKEVMAGDLVYGWPSHGIASNGFSLARRVFKLDTTPDMARKRLERIHPEFSGRPLFEVLLESTPIWIKEIEKIRKKGVNFSAHAHITGGGLIDNPPRLLDDHCLKFVFDRSSWQRPLIFELIQKKGKVSLSDMERSFNNGLMMISVVSQDNAKIISPNGPLFLVGHIERRKKGEPPVVLTNQYL
jgi:phosphoribosylformylglycinamidine cyclo-ligase